jgi:hypothetical protein
MKVFFSKSESRKVGVATNVGGYFQILDNGMPVIWVRPELNADDSVVTARHELIHALQAAACGNDILYFKSNLWQCLRWAKSADRSYFAINGRGFIKTVVEESEAYLHQANTKSPRLEYLLNELLTNGSVEIKSIDLEVVRNQLNA